MNNFWRLFLGCLLQLSPFSFLSLYPFGDHLRLSKKLTVAATVFLLSLLSFLFAIFSLNLRADSIQGTRLFQQLNINFVILLIPLFLFYFHIVDAIPQKKMFLFSFTMTGALVLNSLSHFTHSLLEHFLHRNDNFYAETYSECFLAITFVYTMIGLPFMKLWIKKRYIPVADGLTKKESAQIGWISWLLFVMFAANIIPLSYKDLNYMTLLLYITLIGSVFFIYLISFNMMFQANEKYIAENSLMKVQKQLDINREQYKRLLENIENLRRIRHDIRHNIIAVKGYLQSGDHLHALEYLDNYFSQLESYELVQLSKNATVNVIVNYYRSLAIEQTIRFKAKINIPEEIGVEDSDIAVLLGNLLENAVMAASAAQEEKKFIHLNILSREKMIVLTLDNGFSGKLLFEDDTYRSTKKNHSGLGLASIRSIVEAYDGGMEINGENSVFYVSIMLNEQLAL